MEGDGGNGQQSLGAGWMEMGGLATRNEEVAGGECSGDDRWGWV